uniref:HtrA serine peptidase 4 n=1 Tax=Capra hircus TaxID=9925 RepID=A0A452EMF5_CAPHI
PPRPRCSAGTAPVLDRCGCCRVCAAAEGEACGGPLGRPCAPGLQCRAPRAPQLLGGRPLGTCGCPAAGGTVCGSDGRTYPSLCALRAENRAARLRGALPAVPVQKGGCGDPGEPRAAGWPRSKFNFIASVVEKVAPSVVHLQLFRRSPLGSEDVPASSASGFIVSEDGLIVTNAHVLTNQQRIQVELQSGVQYEATVKDIDHKLDLALIKIEPNTDLPVLLLGKSSDLRAGEFVVALGSPFSLQNTVTAGIVSTTQRGGKELGLKDSDMDYIQTDAIINVSHGGGCPQPDGDVIGINTLKVTAGISFAIPSDRIRQFLAEFHERQLKGKALSQKKYLGLRMLPLTMNLLQEMKRQDPEFPDVASGVFVHEVIQGTAAESSGLKDHDVIVSINGLPVTTTTDVIEAVKANDSLSLLVRRKSQTLILTVTPEIIN